MRNDSDITKAIEQLKSEAARYAKAARYYKGDHDLAFATPKFKNAFGQLFREFSLNLCPAVVDALKDNLVIKEFRVEEGSSKLSDKAWEIWQRNRMGRRSRQIHKEAIKNGDAYVMVWVDLTTPEKKAVIYPQKSELCTVSYDEEIPGKVLWAAKYWLIQDPSPGAKVTDKKIRFNMYYPDRTERYITSKKATTLPAKATDFIEFTNDEGKSEIANPYGIVPIFHFANNADVGEKGISELENAYAPQDALNKSVLDMLVAMEFASYRQRWAAGIEIEYDDDGNAIPPFKSGVERLWITENENAKMGDFEAADLEQFLKIKADFRVDIACVTGTPLYYFMLTNGEAPSGESLKKGETRFIKKATDRQEDFGEVWESVKSFCILIEDGSKNVRFFVDWHDAAPIDEKEKLENIVIKKDGIGISEQQAMTEAGYGKKDIERMQQEKKDKADELINSFNAGDTSQQ